MENYLPINEAARKIRLSEVELLQLSQLGKIKSVMVHNEILLREIDVMAQRANYAHLEGVPIGIGEAARKYGIPHQTLSRWKEKGYIQVLSQQGQKVFLNEADVAYSVDRYREDPGQGKWTRKKAD